MKRVIWLCLVLATAPAAGQGFPFPKTRTPTRTPTPRPPATATPGPAATSTPLPAVTPAPTASAGDSVVTLVLETVVTGVQITGPQPIRYEVRSASGEWRTLTPRSGCWTFGTACVSLEPTALMRVTFPGGAIREQRIRLTQPRIQLAQSAGSVALVSFTTPQPQP